MRALFVAVLCLIVSIGHFQAPIKCIPTKCTSTGGLQRCNPKLPRSVKISAVKAVEAHVDGDTGKPCIEGYHYGAAARWIWVDQKCGGNFRICYRPNKEMRCGYRMLTSPQPRISDWPTGIIDDIHVLYVRRKLNNRCIKGETYDKVGPRVRISGGCRANFYICVLN